MLDEFLEAPRLGRYSESYTLDSFFAIRPFTRPCKAKSSSHERHVREEFCFLSHEDFIGDIKVTALAAGVAFSRTLRRIICGKDPSILLEGRTSLVQ